MTTSTLTKTLVVTTAADLAALLPAEVYDRVAWELVEETPSASALRLLVTVGNPGWHEHIHGANIDWPGMLAWARDGREILNHLRVRVEIAASLAGHRDAQPNLMWAMRVLDGGNHHALMDALRIAREGLSS